MTDYQISASYNAENGTVALTVFDLNDATEGDSIIDQCKVGKGLVLMSCTGRGMISAPLTNIEG